MLDESSIIKHHAAKTLQTLLNAFGATPYHALRHGDTRPNDWTELGNHAQFLASDPERKCLPSSSSMTAATRRHGALKATRDKCSGGGRIVGRWCARRQTFTMPALARCRR